MLKTTIRLVNWDELQVLLHNLVPLQVTILNANDMAILRAIEDFLREGHAVYGAFTVMDNQLIGLVRFGEEDFQLAGLTEVKETLIGILFVDPGYRDQGVGTKLVQFALQHASTPYVIADPLDEPAHQFFAHCGFKPNHLFDMNNGGDWLMITKRID